MKFHNRSPEIFSWWACTEIFSWWARTTQHKSRVAPHRKRTASLCRCSLGARHRRGHVDVWQRLD